MSLVVNFDYPLKVFTYFHRIGRTGRFGAKGLAVTFLQGKEEKKAIEGIPNIRITGVKNVSALLKVSEAVLEQRAVKAKEENKLIEYGFAETNKRRAKIKWKESERYAKESMIGNWKDVGDEEIINPEYKFYCGSETEECTCIKCKEMDEKAKEEFEQFRNKVTELYNCPDCSKIINCLIQSLTNH